MAAHQYVIREATQDDCEAIYSLIMELAVFEKAPEQVYNTVEGNLHGNQEGGHQRGEAAKEDDGEAIYSLIM